MTKSKTIHTFQVERLFREKKRKSLHCHDWLALSGWQFPGMIRNKAKSSLWWISKEKILYLFLLQKWSSIYPVPHSLYSNSDCFEVETPMFTTSFSSVFVCLVSLVSARNFLLYRLAYLLFHFSVGHSDCIRNINHIQKWHFSKLHHLVVTKSKTIHGTDFCTD